MTPGVEVFGLGCPKLVPLIESEKFGRPEMQEAIKEYVDAMKVHGIDTPAVLVRTILSSTMRLRPLLTSGDGP